MSSYIIILSFVITPKTPEFLVLLVDEQGRLSWRFSLNFLNKLTFSTTKSAGSSVELRKQHNRNQLTTYVVVSAQCQLFNDENRNHNKS